MEFIDIEPMCITFNHDDEKWYHPEINEYYTPSPHMEPFKHDTDVYRVYYKNSKGEKLYVYFKSPYLDKAVENFDFLSDDNFFDTVDLSGFPIEMEVTLREDTWMPGGEQFCFTEFGSKVGEFFRHNPEIDFFSIDCGMVPYTEDGETEWVFDS